MIGTETVPALSPGVVAFTTTRLMGSFGLTGDEPVGIVNERWRALATALRTDGSGRLASAHQIHGAHVVGHDAGWAGHLRMDGVDGHYTSVPGTALAMTAADCVPVFIAHPRGAIAALHAGWRGTAAGILSEGLAHFDRDGLLVSECRVHLGPAICGDCYEVGPEVAQALGLPSANANANGNAKENANAFVDLRELLGRQAVAQGIQALSVSAWCTRCHRDRFFSHRGGDAGRQLGIIALPAGSIGG